MRTDNPDADYPIHAAATVQAQCGRLIAKAKTHGSARANDTAGRRAGLSDSALKVICNDFLVVKVNCWSHALI